MARVTTYLNFPRNTEEAFLFYKSIFALFALNPVPFRLLCFAVLVANIYLTFSFSRRLTGSQTTAGLTALIHCYHANSSSLYYNTGTCYDLFCFFFYFAAFT